MRVVAVATLMYLALTCVPYAVAWARTPAAHTFTGLMQLPADQMWDLAAQRNAAEHLGRPNRYTTEANAPALVSALYPAVGAVQRVTHLPQILVYHLPRILVVLSLPVVGLWFFGLCFPGEPDAARLATAFALLNVGTGAFLPHVTTIRSSDFAVPESNVLLSAITSPHIITAQLGLLLLFVALAMALRGRPWRQAVGVSLAGGLIISLAHPFLLLPFLIASGVITVLVVTTQSWRPRRAAAVRCLLAVVAGVIAISIPTLLANARMTQRYERVQGHPFPATPADAWWTWVLGFGVLVPLAAVGLAWAARRKQLLSVGPLVLVAWLVCQFPLVVLGSLPFQRRFAEGLLFPLAGLAGMAVSRLARIRHAARAPAIVTAVVTALAILTIGHLSAYGHFLSDDTDAALARIRRGEVVLAGDQMSAVLPGLTSGSVYLGRQVETVAWSRKVDERARFAADPTSIGSIEWLRMTGITTLIVDGTDPTFDPARELRPPCYEQRARLGSVTLYRFAPHCRAT